MDGTKTTLVDSLSEQAKLLREKIIQVVSKNGGHLGASLGATDIILALHQVFDSPNDKIIFDTGHQAYAHKLLTDRKDQFETLRTYRGLSGFTDPLESEHDHFFAGHAGTALSLAMGVHDSLKQKDQAHWTIAMIGDASLSCGLTLEALNNINSSHKRLIIILNDNGMSISKGCGNFHHYLDKIQNFPFGSLQETFHNIFSIFQLQYIGPVNGHDPEAMVNLFEKIKQGNGPFLIHIKTVKGYGLAYAESSPTLWHGPKPFCIESGKFKQTTSNLIPFPKLFGKELLVLAKTNLELVVLTPATATGACLEPFSQIYPERFYDVGIAEGHAVTYSAGLSRFQKKQVILSIYATFLQRALDNLFHDIVLQQVPVLIAIDRAGISPQDGSTHHGIYDIGFLKAMPGLIVAQPRNGQVLQEVLHSYKNYEAPVVIRYPNLETTPGENPLKYRQPGCGELLIQTSAQEKKILLVPLGHMVENAFKVRDYLIDKGLDASIFDPVFIKPLDKEQLLKLLDEHDAIFIIEEHSRENGLGSIIASLLLENQVRHKRFHIFGVPDYFVAHGTYQELMEEIGLTPHKIANCILKMMSALPQL